MRVTFAAATAGLTVLALAPTSAFAVDYMTAEQATKQLFPDAERVELRDWALGGEALQKLAALGVRPRSTRWTLRVAWRGKELLGVVIADEVIGKFELISYAVGVNADGRVRGIEILSYRESHGGEIRLPAWRKQFVGKTTASPISVGEDIASVSGATLSCSHVTEGVKRIVAVIDVARRSGVVG
jgi:Na+-translocating ferredoxin:NAD+ oxidoreductase RnfG subunit